MLQYRAVTYFIMLAIVFSIFSIPFLVGIMRPTFSEGNPYSIFYAICNFPATFLLRDLIQSVASYLYDSPTTHQMDLSEYYVSVVVWSLVGAVWGFVKDLRGGDTA